MKGLFKGTARVAAAGALGLAAVAATAGGAQAQGWHSGWRHYGATTVVRCNAWGTHCRRIVVYNYAPYYGGYHRYHHGWGYRHHDRYGYGYGYERHHRW
jgi:hypothetical protein